MNKRTEKTVTSYFINLRPIPFTRRLVAVMREVMRRNFTSTRTEQSEVVGLPTEAGTAERVNPAKPGEQTTVCE